MPKKRAASVERQLDHDRLRLVAEHVVDRPGCRGSRIALVGAVNLEALCAALAYRDFPGIPSIYDVLRDEPQAVVIELPFFGRGGFFGNARYMIYATRRRHPLVNGYSGFAPPGLEATAETMRAFPGEAALDWMRRWASRTSSCTATRRKCSGGAP